MSAIDATHKHEPAPPERLIATAALALALGYLVVLAGGVLSGEWLIDSLGRPIASDFVNVWAAGRLAAQGHAALAYDWTVHKAMEVQAVGHDFANYYGWHYPPPFLFIAMLLSSLPILPAMACWLAVTLVPFAATVRSIAGTRAGYFVALGFPATLWNVTPGQNGFFTASLIGGTLVLLERAPVAAGICLGLLTYKPHFGVLFPIALLAGRHWRAFIAAAVTAAVMMAASWLAFGTVTWLAFVDATPKMTHAVLGEGLADFGRLQSLYGLVRGAGGGATLAWTVQGIAALACAAIVARVWLGRTPYALKAAALATAALIATPYLYIYDLVILVIPVAYLIRLGLARGFTRAECVGLPAAVLLLLSYPYVATQVGLAAVLVVAALIALRVRAAAATA